MLADLADSFTRREELAANSSEVSTLITEDHFIEGQKVRLLAQDRTIFKAQKKMQKALEIYKRERQKLKTIEKVRERDLEEFKKARNKYEQAQIEDLMVMRARFRDEETA